MSKSYNKDFLVDCTPAEAFRAITTEMNEWWGKTSNHFLKLGDTAKVTFAEMDTYWIFEATGLSAPNHVVLKCIESHHKHPGQKEDILTEWLHTELVFEMESVEGKTKVSFTHKGLTSDLYCFDICEGGWNHFIGDSLKSHLTKG